MRLEITPCYTFFDEFFEENNDYLRTEKLLNEELSKRKICLSKELIDQIEKNVKSINKDKFQQLFSKRMVVNNQVKKVRIEATSNFKYEEILEKTSLQTRDKIILTKSKINGLSSDIETIETKELCKSDDAKIILQSNSLNKYRLPILWDLNDKVSPAKILQYLKKYLENSENITIIDNYLGKLKIDVITNLLDGKDYSKIKFYLQESEIKNKAFFRLAFKDIEMFNADQKETHDRYIILDEIVISLGKGLSAFSGKKLYTTNLTIKKGSYQLPKALKI